MLQRHTTGSTLIEVMCVIAIISVLASILIPSTKRAYANIKNRSVWVSVYSRNRILNHDDVWYLTNNVDDAFHALYGKKRKYSDLDPELVKAWQRHMRDPVK